MVEWIEEKENSDFWMPTKQGEAIEGTIVDVMNGKYGRQLVIEGIDKKQYITPAHKVLQQKLSNKIVGNRIKIVFDGQQLPSVKGEKGAMIYKVFRQAD